MAQLKRSTGEAPSRRFLGLALLLLLAGSIWLWSTVTMGAIPAAAAENLFKSPTPCTSPYYWLCYTPTPSPNPTATRQYTNTPGPSATPSATPTRPTAIPTITPIPTATTLPTAQVSAPTGQPPRATPIGSSAFQSRLPTPVPPTAIRPAAPVAANTSPLKPTATAKLLTTVTPTGTAEPAVFGPSGAGGRPRATPAPNLLPSRSQAARTILIMGGVAVGLGGVLAALAFILARNSRLR